MRKKVTGEEIPMEQTIFNTGWRILKSFSGGTKVLDQLPEFTTRIMELVHISDQCFDSQELSQWIAGAIVHYYNNLLAAQLDNTNLETEMRLFQSFWQLLKEYYYMDANDIEEFTDDIIKLIPEKGLVSSACYALAMDLSIAVECYLFDKQNPIETTKDERKKRKEKKLVLFGKRTA